MTAFRKLGPYRQVRQIGKGGMGDVYLAEDTRKPEDDPRRQVALKVMWRGVEKDNPGVLQAEKQGAQLQARLHKIDVRVARVNDYGEIDDIFFVDMEYIEGHDLTELIQAGPLSASEATRLAIEICDILLRVHTMRFEHREIDSRGVVHGDIKPRNIRIDRMGRVRLLDFGIAKALSMTRRLTHNEFGSMAYSSPERLETGEVDEHSDLWAVAVVLYEMLTGRQPFLAESTKKIEQLIQSRTSFPPPGDHVPRSLQNVLARAMAPRIRDRYLSSVHFKQALQDAYEQIRFAEAPTGETPIDATRRTRKPSVISPLQPGAEAALADLSELDEVHTTRRKGIRAGQGSDPASRGEDATYRSSSQERNARNEDREDRTRRSRAPRVAKEIIPSTERPRAPTANAMNAVQPAHARAVQPAKSESVMDRIKAALPAKPASFGRVARAILIAMLISGLTYVLTVELKVNYAAPALIDEINGRALDCTEAWTRYQTLVGQSILQRNPPKLKRALIRCCSVEAEEVIKRFRTDDPKVYQSHWRAANEALRHVLAVEYSSKMDAWEHYTRAQIIRIDEQFDTARATYDKALELDRKFCDPFLGLWQMYAYKAFDLEALNETRTRALERGCEPGKRQEVQRADAQHREAENLYRNDSTLASTEDRLANLTLVKELLTLAEETYQTYPTFGQAAAHLGSVQRRLTEVERKLETLTQESGFSTRGAPLPWPW